MKTITSRDNALLKRVRRLLSSAAERREQGCTILDGPHLIDAYLERYGPHGVDLVVARSRVHQPEIATLAARLGEDRGNVVEDALFKSLSPVEHPVGVVACVPIPPPPRAAQGPVDMLLLDGIQDPGNVGALLRTACAAGFQHVSLSPGCADAWSPKCLRGGMGAQFHLHIEEDADLLAVLKGFSGQSVACDARASEDLYALSLQGPLAVVMGAEGAGLRPELCAAASHRCRIPMRGGVESLNVGAAAAVVMYEWVRRRALTTA